MDLMYCKPGVTYIIIERIYTKAGLPSLANTVGPNLFQICRWVGQVCDEQQLAYQGKDLPGAPNALQLLHEFISPGQITERPKGKRHFFLVYAGFRNIVQPLPKIGGLIPEVLTKAREFPAPSPFMYGRDPLPTVQLYGDSRITFTTTDVDSPPTAVAIYDKEKSNLIVPHHALRDEALRQLLDRK